MPVNVVMPQMGESVTEGTVVRWIRKVGDHVDRDEPLFEISTDKVDAEIPSPAAGTLAAIHVKEGETVPVDALVAVIAQAGEDVEAGPQPDGVPEKTAAVTPQARAVGAGRAEAQEIQGREGASRAGAPEIQGREGGASGAEAPEVHGREGAASHAEAAANAGREGGRLRSSPLVRRIASEHHLDIGSIAGSGIGGRVTKHDILKVVHAGGTPAPAAADRAAAASRPAGRDGAPAAPRDGHPIGGPGPGGRQAARGVLLGGLRPRCPAQGRRLRGAGDTADRVLHRGRDRHRRPLRRQHCGRRHRR